MINDASTDIRFKDHPGLKRYNINSYIAVPLRGPSGEAFGTLCALDTNPSAISEDDLAIFDLLGELITHQLAAQDQLAHGKMQLEAAHEEGKARDRLIAILGHDLRSPLTAIRTSAQLGRTAIGERDLVDVLFSGIETSVQRMSRMIADLFDFTRGQLGSGIPITRAPSHLGTICRIVVEEIRRGDPDAVIEFDQTNGLELECDADRMAQVISNLVSNALQYREPSTAVRVILCGDSQTAVVRVSNAGAPIPESTKSNLFKAFLRGNHPPAENLGLGLFIANEIVKAHRGMIEVSSGDGWNHFDVQLPRRAQAPADATKDRVG